MHYNVHNDIKKNIMSWFTCSHQTLLQFQNDQSFKKLLVHIPKLDTTCFRMVKSYLTFCDFLIFRVIHYI